MQGATLLGNKGDIQFRGGAGSPSWLGFRKGVCGKPEESSGAVAHKMRPYGVVYA